MLIGKDYEIESDSLNVTLYERRIAKKTQKEYWTPIAYFSQLQNALKALVDLGVKKTELKDFRTVCQKQDELYKLIDSLQISNEGAKKCSDTK